MPIAAPKFLALGADLRLVSMIDGFLTGQN
jgi:hypothetical protein